jgi:exo-beta-1,3-glucanase (GH17 family)
MNAPAPRRPHRDRASRLLALLLVVVAAAVCLTTFAHAARPLERRAFTATLDGRWIGDAIAYGPHRDGQRPGAASPSREQLAEDLRLMARRWHLLRVYGAVGSSEDLLAVIRAERLPLRVVLGAWVAPEERRDSSGRVTERLPAERAANRAERAAAVRLANAYPDVVCAISVGNETQVEWSDHRVPAASLIATLRWVRARTRVPVTTADDFNFWNKSESRAVAAEVDFVMMHAHPLWNGQQLDAALPWTIATVRSIADFHPGLPVVLGETGWATRRHTEGDQAKYMKGALGEAEQRTFFDAVTEWARESRTPVFFFEAFDENWKGGAHPDEVEKHWGLYRADRTPKAAVADGR